MFRRLTYCVLLAGWCSGAGPSPTVAATGPPVLPPPLPPYDVKSDIAPPTTESASPIVEANFTEASTTPPFDGPAFATPSDAVSITVDPSDSEPLPPGDDERNDLADIEIEGDTAWYEPAYWFGPTPWDTGIELGLNGSTGNNESLSIRTGGYMKRSSRFSKLDFSAYYNRTTNGGIATQNNAQMDVRNDWLLDDDLPWTLFGAGSLFYDEFQAFDLQTNASTGIGYRFADGPDLTLIGRAGGGASREFGGPQNEWVPESVVGFEYSQRLSTTQKFSGKLDYYPAWDQIGEYRLVGDASWEIELVQPSNLSLKISATDRYDSTPNGVDPQLINYSVLLLLKL